MGRKPKFDKIATLIKTIWIVTPDARSGDKLPTIREMEDYFGVSRSTVIRSLRSLEEEGFVETREGSGTYIRAGASVPLKPGPLRIIGFVAPHIPKSVGQPNQIILDMYAGLERRALEAGYQVIAASCDFSISREEAVLRDLIRMGARGLLVVPMARHENELATDHLASLPSHPPIVLIDHALTTCHRPSVVFDNVRLGMEMTRLLHRLGRRRIAMLNVPQGWVHRPLQERVSGYIRAAKLLDIPPLLLDMPKSMQDLRTIPPLVVNPPLVTQLLQMDPRPDALICWHDLAVAQARQLLCQAGVQVPGDILLAGFDNLDYVHRALPPFPTSNPDFGWAGEVAMQQLIDILDGVDVPNRIMLQAPVVYHTDREPDEEDNRS